MNLELLGPAAGLLAVAGGMIYYELMRTRARRPLGQNEAVAIPYWITYLSLLILGGALLLAAFVR
jgi:hypothetical protein